MSGTNNGENGKHLIERIKRIKFINSKAKSIMKILIGSNIAMIILLVIGMAYVFKINADLKHQPNYVHSIKSINNAYTSLTDTVIKLNGNMKHLEEEVLSANELSKRYDYEKEYTNWAGMISRYHFERGTTADFNTIKKILLAADKFVPKISNGCYNTLDVITIAWIETDFIATVEGKSGERGPWQILNWRHWQEVLHSNFVSPDDIETNCKMACYVLNDKYDSLVERYKKEKRVDKPTKKEVIIAYNGYLVNAAGEVQEKYWKKFSEYRRILEKLKDDSRVCND